MENKIKAEIVLGSINEFGNKITTWKLTFPRIILSEFNTHRMISKNSASSRAIPFATLLERVETEPFIPIKWLKEHKGMQGFDYWEENSNEAIKAEYEWLKARDEAVNISKTLSEINITKQFCNRLLEPFMWHTIIATGTDWENFFALRAHHMAEIHIQDLAYKMLEKYNNYEFRELNSGSWHIPFRESIKSTTDTDVLDLVKVSAGICAGVSYGRIKDNVDITDMIDLHDSLVIRPYSGKRGIREIDDPIHASPCEHQARAMNTLNGISGNFTGGWEQYRKMLFNENAKDRRVNTKDLLLN